MKLLNCFALVGLGLQLTACGGGSSAGGSTSAQSNTQLGTQSNAAAILSPSVATPTTARARTAYIDDVDQTNERIVINGTSYATGATQIRYNNHVNVLDGLESGVKVDVEINNNNVVELELEPTIVGKIRSIEDNTLNVSGVSLSFDSRGRGLAVGDDVFVFTRVQGNTRVVTSVVKNNIPTLTELEGVVSNLDTVNQTFVVLGMTVNYVNAQIDVGDVISNNAWVEVLGQISNNQLHAQVIDVEGRDDYADKEVEGAITWVANDKSAFEVDRHIRVNTNQHTIFEDGSINHLVTDARVSVDMLESNNQLLAKEIEFERVQSTVPNNNPANSTQEFTLSGVASVSGSSVIINGFQFDTDVSTEFKDRLTLQNIPGQYIEIEGVSFSGNNTAKEIEINHDRNRIDLEGLVQTNNLWSYRAVDNSLANFNNTWVNVECQLSGNDLFNCVLDD